MQNKFRAVLFDLDGTLLDTAKDFHEALKHLCEYFDHDCISMAQFRSSISNGSVGMLKRAFNLDQTDPKFKDYQQRFLKYYAENIAVYTQAFNGINELLTELKHRNISWGIVTNKPEWLTTPLLQNISFPTPAQCVVSGDTLSKAKPHPEPLWYAAEQLQLPSATCLYVGDAQRDIEAANSATMTSCIAAYGYIPEDSELPSWQAKYQVEHPLDIIALLDES